MKAQIYGLMVQRLPDLLQERRCSSSDEKRGRILGPPLGLLGLLISHPPWAQRARVLEAGVVGGGGTVLIIHCSSCTSWEPDPGSKRPVLDLMIPTSSSLKPPPRSLYSSFLRGSPVDSCKGPSVSPLAYPACFPRFTCFSSPRARCLPWLPALCHCHQLFDSLFVEIFFLRIQKYFLP